MKETVAIYKKQRVFIENSLTSMIESIDVDQYDMIKEKSIFTLFPALKATYKINANYKQSTPMYTEEGIDSSYFGVDKSHLLGRVQFRADNIYISNAYVNSRSGTPFITVVVHRNKDYIVYDFELYTLLKELALIKGHERFGEYTRYSYAIFGFLLAGFSVALVSYAVYIAGTLIIEKNGETLAGLPFHHRTDAWYGNL